METIKLYTDLEQSKKLAEILPLESADMEYMFLKKDGSKVSNVPFVKDGFEEQECPECGYNFIPCWSLTALINVINTNYYTTLYHDGVAWNIDIIHHDNVKEKHSVYANTPIDACYEIILKLYEQKLL
jgi:hypothetical protein